MNLDSLKNKITLGDCMDYMKLMPDNYIDLAVVDPPYGLDNKMVQRGGKHKNSKFAVLYENSNRWDIVPDKNYFDELFRVSKNQIVCGSNYFELPPTRGIVCWDKKQMLPTFSRWELIWTSFDKPAKIYSASSADLKRIHPTQKPVSLYRWILQNYAKPGDLILDTHSGFGSCAIACHLEHYDFIAIEKDIDYHRDSVKRYETEISQGRLF